MQVSLSFPHIHLEPGRFAKIDGDGHDTRTSIVVKGSQSYQAQQSMTRSFPYMAVLNGRSLTE